MSLPRAMILILPSSIAWMPNATAAVPVACVQLSEQWKLATTAFDALGASATKKPLSR